MCNTLTDTWISGEVKNSHLVLIGERVERVDILSLGNEVCFEAGAEDGEAVLHVEPGVVRVGVDCSHVNLLARPGTVNQVVKQNHLLLAWQATGRDSPWALLQRQLLIVAVDGL